MPTPLPNKRPGAQCSPPPEAPSELHQRLAEAEAARARQLTSLPDGNLDPVAAAHRDSVERILQDIRRARDRLARGQYGVCATCGSTIAAERLELHAWATTCVRCDDRRWL